MSVKFEVATVATTIDKLLEWDKQPGTRIRFKVDGHEFLKLNASELKQLSSETRLAYDIAREERAATEQTNRTDEDNLLASIKAGYESGSATKRLEIRNQQKGFVYKWLTPDMVDEYMAKGYQIVKDGPETTMANPEGKGPHVISREGRNELVAVMRSVKLEQASRDAKRKRGAELRAQVDSGHEALVERDGFNAVNDGTRGSFKSVVERDE